MMHLATNLEDRDEATQWIARLRAHDVSPTDRARFIEWLAEEEHRREFDALLCVWEQLGCIAEFDL
jgi:ferric-dicitrate binding protein FerR (iron transport regulator)